MGHIAYKYPRNISYQQTSLSKATIIYYILVKETKNKRSIVLIFKKEWSFIRKTINSSNPIELYTKFG